MNPELNETPAPLATGRRSVIKAAAWAAPVAVVATAAPAFATSGTRPAVGVQLPDGTNAKWEMPLALDIASASRDGVPTEFEAKLNISGRQKMYYYLSSNGAEVADATYFTSVTIVLTWNFEQPVIATVVNDRDWDYSGTLTASRTGTLTFTTYILNGESQARVLPEVTFGASNAIPSSGELIMVTDADGMAKTEAKSTFPRT